MIQRPPRSAARPSTAHLALEAVQYALLAVVSVLVAVVVIATFIRIVKQPVPERTDVPVVTTTVFPADPFEAAGATPFRGF